MKKITLVLFTFLAFQWGNAQDTCATALSITSGIHTVTAVNGADVPAPICAPNGAGATFGEWYVFTATLNGVGNVRTDVGTTPTNADTRVHIYTGACGSLVCAGGNDDINEAGNNFRSSATFAITSGTTYYIAFDNRWSAAGFQFQLSETVVACDTTIPNNQTFDDNNVFLACYSRQDVDGDGISWISQQDLDLDGDTVPETFATNGNSTVVKNDWLFSPGFSLTGGVEYEVTSIFNTFSGNGSLAAFVTDAPSSTAPNQIPLFSQTNIVPQGVFATLETNAYVQSNTFTPATSGTYYVAYHSFGPASSGFILLFDSNLSSTLSVDEFENNTFKHFYNKDTDVLTMTSSTLAFDNVELYNLLGQQVLNKSLSLTNETVNMSSLEDGVYLAKVSIQGRTQTVKILKN